MSVVAQRYGYSVQYEVVNDRVGQAFSDAATEAKLRVAGAPRITQKDEAPEGSCPSTPPSRSTPRSSSAT
jgi:trigger factor